MTGLVVDVAGLHTSGMRHTSSLQTNVPDTPISLKSDIHGLHLSVNNLPKLCKLIQIRFVKLSFVLEIINKFHKNAVKIIIK